jgi:hypothetical protein
MAVVAAVARIRESRSNRARPRRWSDLPSWEKAALITVGSIELALTATAAVDLCKRPRALLRGPKALWWPAILVQPVGPIAYLAIGRRADGRRRDL